MNEIATTTKSAFYSECNDDFFFYINVNQNQKSKSKETFSLFTFIDKRPKN